MFGNKISILKTSVLTLVCAAGFFSGSLKAQSARGLINDGVELYKDKKFGDSEVNFKKGMEKVPDSFNAYFNLGDAQYKQERYDEALKSYQQSLAKTGDKNLKAKAYHNIGNSLLKSQKLKESVEAYKNALKLNPNDKDTKYNLSYALNLLKEQNNQQQKNKNDKQDNKQDKNNQNNQNNQNKKDQNDQDKNKDQNKQNQDQNKDQNKDQNNQNQQDKPNQDQKAQQDNTKQQQQDKEKMSKEEAERILNAIRNNEQDLQKKLRKHEGKAVRTDKDW